jgi:hypothetical protein
MLNIAMQDDNNEEAMMSKTDWRVIWDEAFRRAAERRGDPEEHLREMMQEVLDSLVADGIIEPVGPDQPEQWPASVTCPLGTVRRRRPLIAARSSAGCAAHSLAAASKC